MRTSWARLYAPFLVLALVQGIIIAVAPSNGGSGQQLATFGPSQTAPLEGAPGATGPVAAPGDQGGVAAPVLAQPGVESAVAPTAPVGGSGPGAAAPGTTQAGTTATTVTPAAPATPAGDTSHCTPDGKQFAITRAGGPPCAPKWVDGADNGGSTFRGVTAEEVKVVYFSSEPNEQVNAVLAPQGLAVDEEDFIAALDVYFAFLNEYFETYGRKVVYKRIVGDCPTTPPDYDACIAAAQEVVKEDPFLVIWGTSLYDSVFDVWAKNGIPSLGGQHFEEKFFTQRRPYRYDVAMDGTQSARHISEYYCTKMAGGVADHAGVVIHPQIGGRDTPRKLGVIVPEIEANVLNAQLVAREVKACGGGDVPVLTYESDIERATEQTAAVVAKLIAEGVTSVSCMCDPIAPAFLTKGLSGNRYFPEFITSGLGLSDADAVGRLYDAEVMAHAFGPTHLPLNVDRDETDMARVWQTMGNDGHPCGNNGCFNAWRYVNLLGTMVHMAGPNLNPLTVEQGLLQNMPDRGGFPEKELMDYGPGDYTGHGDTKEVYWSNTAVSSVDGRNGTYVPVNGGKRYRLGEWTPGLDQIPVAAQ